jgi:hypothetical protein
MRRTGWAIVREVGLHAGSLFRRKAEGLRGSSCVLLHADGTPCFDYFYKRDLVTNRPTNSVFHCGAVAGDRATGQLIGYVEFVQHIADGDLSFFAVRGRTI